MGFFRAALSIVRHSPRLFLAGVLAITFPLLRVEWNRRVMLQRQQIIDEREKVGLSTPFVRDARLLPEYLPKLELYCQAGKCVEPDDLVVINGLLPNSTIRNERIRKYESQCENFIQSAWETPGQSMPFDQATPYNVDLAAYNPLAEYLCIIALEHLGRNEYEAALDRFSQCLQLDSLKSMSLLDFHLDNNKKIGFYLSNGLSSNYLGHLPGSLIFQIASSLDSYTSRHICNALLKAPVFKNNENVPAKSVFLRQMIQRLDNEAEIREIASKTFINHLFDLKPSNSVRVEADSFLLHPLFNAEINKLLSVQTQYQLYLSQSENADVPFPVIHLEPSLFLENPNIPIDENSFYRPILDGILAESRNQITLQRTTRVFLACQLYRLEHGKLPDQLQDLVPQYLTQIPIDIAQIPPAPIVMETIIGPHDKQNRVLKYHEASEKQDDAKTINLTP